MSVVRRRPGRAQSCHVCRRVCIVFFLCVQTDLFFSLLYDQIWLLMVILREMNKCQSSLNSASLALSFFLVFREIEFAPVYTVYNKKYGVFFSERSCALRVTVHGTAYTVPSL